MWGRLLIAMILAISGISNAEGDWENLCLIKAQAQGEMMLSRKDGVSLSSLLYQIDSTENRNPGNVTPQVERSIKSALKQLAIRTYALPYQEPDKLIAEVFNNCLREKPEK